MPHLISWSRSSKTSTSLYLWKRALILVLCTQCKFGVISHKIVHLLCAAVGRALLVSIKLSSGFDFLVRLAIFC